MQSVSVAFCLGVISGGFGDDLGRRMVKYFARAAMASFDFPAVDQE